MPTIHYGDPTNDPSGITIPSDGQGGIKAADVNPALQGTFDKVTALKARIGNVDVLNFVYSIALKTSTTTDVVGAAAWLQGRNRWIFATKSDSAHLKVRLWTGAGVGAETTDVSETIASSIYPIAMAAHPTESKAVIAVSYPGPGTATATVAVYDDGDYDEVTFSVANTGYVQKGITYFAGKWIVVFKNGSDHAFASSADGSTWTEGAGADGFTVAHDAPVLMAKSPTVCIAFPRNTIGEAASPYTRTGEYLRTTDGATWTKLAPSWSGPAITYVGGIFWTGLTYDAVREVFVLVGYGNDGANDMMVWTSPDGLAWTYAGPSIRTARPWGIAAHGGVWIAPVTEVHGSNREVAVSPDAGVTWSVVGGGFDFDGGLTGSLLPTPLSNGAQVLIATDQLQSASLVSRRPPYDLEALP